MNPGWKSHAALCSTAEVPESSPLNANEPSPQKPHEYATLRPLVHLVLLCLLMGPSLLSGQLNGQVHEEGDAALAQPSENVPSGNEPSTAKADGHESGTAFDAENRSAAAAPAGHDDEWSDSYIQWVTSPLAFLEDFVMRLTQEAAKKDLVVLVMVFTIAIAGMSRQAITVCFNSAKRGLWLGLIGLCTAGVSLPVFLSGAPLPFVLLSVPIVALSVFMVDSYLSKAIMLFLVGLSSIGVLVLAQLLVAVVEGIARNDVRAYEDVPASTIFTWYIALSIPWGCLWGLVFFLDGLEEAADKHRLVEEWSQERERAVAQRFSRVKLRLSRHLARFGLASIWTRRNGRSRN